MKRTWVRVCPRGHDTARTGTYRTGRCRQCALDAAHARRLSGAARESERRTYQKRRPRLIEAMRWRALRRKYGITESTYREMLRAICGNPPGKKRLHVDHDHQSGGVRELLCTPCNTLAGLLESKRRPAVEAYLKKHEEVL